MKLPSVIQFLFLLATSNNIPVLEAYPVGAGGCTGGQAAVGPPHRFRSNVTTGTLSDGGFVVTLDGKTLTPGTVASFDISSGHKLTLQAGPTKFLGFLVRMAAGTSGLVSYEALAPYDYATTRYSVICLNDLVGALTHSSPSEKTSVSANLTFPVAWDGLPLDVTVVVENDEDASVFYYSRFVLNAVSGGGRKKPVKKGGKH